jgi:hypothetical protein
MALVRSVNGRSDIRLPFTNRVSLDCIRHRFFGARGSVGDSDLEIPRVERFTRENNLSGRVRHHRTLDGRSICRVYLYFGGLPWYAVIELHHLQLGNKILHRNLNADSWPDILRGVYFSADDCDWVSTKSASESQLVEISAFSRLRSIRGRFERNNTCGDKVSP